MKESSYLEKFKKMADEISRHPLLEVGEFSINPPAAGEVFDEIERKLKTPLDAAIRSFYGEANGLRLYWRFRPGLPGEILDQVMEKCDDYQPEDPENDDKDDMPFAQIRLLPIDEAIIHRDWEGEIFFPEAENVVEFAGSEYKETQFMQCLKPFDLYNSYSCMAFFLEEGVGNPRVLNLGNSYVEWDNSKLTDFASYLQMLLATRGICEARDVVYSEYRGDKKPKLITGADYWTADNIPKIFMPSITSLKVPGESPAEPDELEKPDIPALIKQLKSRKKSERLETCEQLGTLGDKAGDALPQLLKMLKKEKSEDVRLEARDTILAIGPGDGDNEEILEVLVSYLEESDDILRTNAVEILASYGSKALPAAAALQERLKGESSRKVRYALALAIANIKPEIIPELIPLLLEIQRDRFTGYAQKLKAIEACVRLDCNDKGVVLQLIDNFSDTSFREVVEASVEAVIKMGDFAIPFLLEELKNENYAAKDNILLVLDRYSQKEDGQYKKQVREILSSID